MGGQPTIHFAAVPCGVLHAPGVAGGRSDLRAGGARVEMKWQQVTIRIFGVRLIERGAAGGERDRGRVAEAADSGERAEIMIEGAIFLHQQNYVLDVGERTAVRRALRQHAAHVGRHQSFGGRGGGESGGALQQAAARELAGGEVRFHGILFFHG